MKVAWFRGDCRHVWPPVPPRSMDAIYSSIGHVSPAFAADELELVLVPDDADLRSLYGDDWDDAPADCNAGPPYEHTLPPGSVVLRVHLGDRLEVRRS